MLDCAKFPQDNDMCITAQSVRQGNNRGGNSRGELYLYLSLYFLFLKYHFGEGKIPVLLITLKITSNQR